MDAINNLLGRRSIRKYTSQTISDPIIRDLLNAGMHAPTARNRQPWHFVVVNDRRMIDGLSEAHPYAKMLSEAPLAILVCGDRTLQEEDAYLVQDCSAATQNIMLAAHAHGLGSVWLGMYPRNDRMDNVGKLLDLPQHILPVALISIGYPDEIKEAPERFNEERVHWNRF